MQDRWYADNRDLVKWGIMLKLAEIFGAQRILQLAFYRPNTFGRIVIDGQAWDMPAEVISHFRNCRKICTISNQPQVTVFDAIFEDRGTYLQSALEFLKSFSASSVLFFSIPTQALNLEIRISNTFSITRSG